MSIKAAFESSARKPDLSEGSPLKEKLAKVRKTLGYAPASTSGATADASSATPSAILEALEGINDRLKHVALKSDLDVFKSAIAQNTKIQIAEALKPP